MSTSAVPAPSRMHLPDTMQLPEKRPPSPVYMPPSYEELLAQVESAQKPPRRRPRRILPLVLFLLTCVSTWLAQLSWQYAVCIMTILTFHEFGHYLQARRYGIPASLPYFIPFPTLFGTMGAVIAMQPGTAHRKALFDIAITGPLAGLVPALFMSYFGLGLSEHIPVGEVAEGAVSLGEPLIFKLLQHLSQGPTPEGFETMLHPIAFAGWVGIFITALNLIPIGQLDGGHILYSLVPRHAPKISSALYLGAAAFMVLQGLWWPILLMLLLLLFGVRHPPTTNDRIPLGTGRIVLGWLTLAFLLVGFTPIPIEF